MKKMSAEIRICHAFDTVIPRFLNMNRLKLTQCTQPIISMQELLLLSHPNMHCQRCRLKLLNCMMNIDSCLFFFLLH